jgi:Zn-dependent protease
MIIGITVHEFSHALLAHQLGDKTSQALGRLSLNPLAHLDPIGTLMLLIAGFGWGKPVPVNPYSLRYGAKAGMMIVSLAGPLSNLVTAFVFALPLRLDMVQESTLGGQGVNIFTLLYFIVNINLILCVFNLLPLAPLDGFKVAVGILPRNMAAAYAQTERYGMMILLGILFLDYLLPVHILSGILSPPLRLLGALVGLP